MKRKLMPYLLSYAFLFVSYLIISFIMAILFSFMHASSFIYQLLITFFSYLILVVFTFIFYKMARIEFISKIQTIDPRNDPFNDLFNYSIYISFKRYKYSNFNKTFICFYYLLFTLLYKEKTTITCCFMQ